MPWKPYAKALIATLVGALTFAASVAADGISLPDALQIIAAALASGGAVWVMPWMPKDEPSEVTL